MNIGDIIKIRVKTEYGEMNVSFRIIEKFSDHIFCLFAQNRIAVGKITDENEWYLSESFDIMKLAIDFSVSHEQI